MYLQVLGYEKNQKLMQIAWNFMNDSLRTDVFVRYHPETIACACIYLTARKLNFPLPNNPSWFGIFKVSEDSIIDVSYRICELYRRPKVTFYHTTLFALANGYFFKQPSVETLEQSVEELKKKYMESRNKNRPGQSTPPAVTTVDRSNGSHNAWGGFISRTIPAAVEGGKVAQNKRSHSRSRSRSHTPVDDGRSRARKKSRHRSRSPTKYNKKKSSRNYSRSPSTSPHSKHNKKRYISAFIQSHKALQIFIILSFLEMTAKVLRVKNRITIRMVAIASAAKIVIETGTQEVRIVLESVIGPSMTDIILAVATDRRNTVRDPAIENDKITVIVEPTTV